MFYQPISIREAIESVNDTWFLPAIQRPYDWGERNKKEEFIYKLFDSVIREYPIGTLIVWKTSKAIPYRPFLEDYDAEKLTRIADKGLWKRKDKHLIYDGQQRLQSLYSCLKYTFHNKILCYDLLFNLNVEKESTGFKFLEKHKEPEANYIRLNEVYSCNRKHVAEFEDEVLDRIRKVKNPAKKEELLIKGNLKQLLKIFVETDTRLLSYYPLEKEMDEEEVLGIFKRINTTGMQLTNSEILFSELKKNKFDFEEKMWEASLEIKKQTGNGFSFGPDNILQTAHLIAKETVRIDPERIDKSDRKRLIDLWSDLRSPLYSFFYDFLYREFKVTHEKIVTYKQPMLPLITYFYYMRTLKNKKFRDFSQKSLDCMKKYFIVSQLCDWTLQGHVDEFHRIIRRECEKKGNTDFPYQKIKNFVQRTEKRYTEPIDEYLDYPYHRWLVLKIISPERAFSFECDPDERFNPEIDHIFPTTPDNPNRFPKKYFRWVNTIWNQQAVKGEINNHKRAKLPQDFFLKYPKYLKDYDFLPSSDPRDEIWQARHAPEFIQERKRRILSGLRRLYGFRID